MARKKKPKQSIDAFAARAKALGMTYGQLQVLETVEMLRQQREKEKQEKQTAR